MLQRNWIGCPTTAGGIRIYREGHRMALLARAAFIRERAFPGMFRRGRISLTDWTRLIPRRMGRAATGITRALMRAVIGTATFSRCESSRWSPIPIAVMVLTRVVLTT